MKVLKFGGTSVGTEEALIQVRELIKTSSDNQGVIVVVSAVGGITNKLQTAVNQAFTNNIHYESTTKDIETTHITLVKRLLPVHKQSAVISHIKAIINELEDILRGVYLLQELSMKINDYVLCFGERLSSFIIHAFIHSEIDIEYLDAGKLLVCDRNFGKGNILFEETSTLVKNAIHSQEGLFLMAGFIAKTKTGEWISLGRGGSDYTASLLAAICSASELQVWTDVDGMMTADPRWVKQAKSIPQLSYEDALELSHFGAKVIYPPSIQPAMSRGIPIKVLNTFNPSHPGSLITKNWQNNQSIVGISSISSITLITLSGSGMVGIPSFSFRLFQALSTEGISVILITQASSEHSICVAIEDHLTTKAVGILSRTFHYEISHHILDPVCAESDVSIIALVGSNMRNQVGISGDMFHTLGKNGINIKAISQGSSERNISAVIDRKNLKKAINSLHEHFFTDETRRINLYLIGIGNVGKALVYQIKKQKEYLKDNHHLQIRLIGVANSKKMVFSEDGIPLDEGISIIESGVNFDLSLFLEKIRQFNLRNSVFIDCTASDILPNVYSELLTQSVAIITPNKIAATRKFSSYLQLKKEALKYKTHFLFETNVCAGLPVISTLSDLMKSGDRILRIEAVLSGTLNYLFNKYDGSQPFAEIVEEAKNLGLTEPDPRLDLTGEDVRRKILILARESGSPLELENVSTSHFIPEECMSSENFMELKKALLQHEDHFLKLLGKAKKNGLKMRYVAWFEGDRAGTELMEVDQFHPFYTLEGKDNCILFFTERYSTQPLQIKGAGAGADVTASGIFADLMRLSYA